MISFSEKKYRNVRKIVKYYTDRGFGVKVVLWDNTYVINIEDPKKPSNKKLLKG